MEDSRPRLECWITLLLWTIDSWNVKIFHFHLSSGMQLLHILHYKSSRIWIFLISHTGDRGKEIKLSICRFDWPGRAYCWLSMRGWRLAVTCWKYRSEKFPHPGKIILWHIFFFLERIRSFVICNKQNKSLSVYLLLVVFNSIKLNILSFKYFLLQWNEHECFAPVALICIDVFT